MISFAAVDICPQSESVKTSEVCDVEECILEVCIFLCSTPLHCPLSLCALKMVFFLICLNINNVMHILSVSESFYTTLQVSLQMLGQSG